MTEDEKAPRGDPPAEQWPDTLGFWLVVTLLVIAVPSLLCGLGFLILRRIW